tara:strand:+ start:449 stop:676 length:228 start_codon:yes stop_codon:yes gene_type:complete
MKQNEKPYQFLAWIATTILILAAALASFVPELEYHHWAFISANTLWVLVGILWREQTLIILNAGLTIIYILGLIF